MSEVEFASSSEPCPVCGENKVKVLYLDALVVSERCENGCYSWNGETGFCTVPGGIGGDEVDLECPKCEAPLVTAEFLHPTVPDDSLMGYACDRCGYYEVLEEHALEVV